jgi:hypothetical protein
MMTTPVDRIAVDHWLCELCRRYRPGKPCAFGIDWTADGYWVCEQCLRAYRLENAGAGKEEAYASTV